jgi:hypothetical protein
MKVFSTIFKHKKDPLGREGLGLLLLSVHGSKQMVIELWQINGINS